MAAVEREIQYFKTPDGLNVAYYEEGTGYPFVYLSLPFSHLTAERPTAAERAG